MPDRTVRLVIPTGRLHDAVIELLAGAGLDIPRAEKQYRPRASDPRFEIKLLKAANIPTLIELGAQDVGFSGLDWIRESEARVETLLDTDLLPVRIVAAATVGGDPFSSVTGRPVVVASEYERLTRHYMEGRNVDWRYVRTWGATEVFPPEDADLIVDNTSTGSTLAAHRLEVIDEIMTSTTRFIGNQKAIDDPAVRDPIEDLCLLMRSVLEARKRVLLEMNVGSDSLDRVVALLPAMKAPTIQRLYGDGLYSVKAAVPVDQVPRLIPKLIRAGATDILEAAIRRVIS